MHDARLQQAKIRQAEAKIRTMKIARDSAYVALVTAQQGGAGPDRRRRLTDAYDRAEEKLEAAENEARELKRKALGLTQGGASFVRAIGQSVVSARPIGGGAYEARVRRGTSFRSDLLRVIPDPADVAEFGEEVAVAMAANRGKQ